MRRQLQPQLTPQCRFRWTDVVVMFLVLLLLLLLVVERPFYDATATTPYDSISSIAQSLQRRQSNILSSNKIQQQPHYLPPRISLLHQIDDTVQRISTPSTKKSYLMLLFQNKMRGGGSDTSVTTTTTTINDDDTTNPSFSQPPQQSQQLPLPVTILVQTNTGSSIIDPIIELPLVNPNKRTILSIKQSIQRQLAVSTSASSSSSKPPISSIRLIYQGQILNNDELLLADVLDDDDDTDDDENTETKNTKSNDGKQIQMYLDMIPPVVDSKNYIYDIESKLDDQTTSELLLAYATNEASIYYNTQLVESLRNNINNNNKNDEEANEDDDAVGHTQNGNETPPPKSSSSSSSSSSLISVQIRERAQQIQKDLMETIFHASSARKLLSDTETPKQKLLQASIARMNQDATEIRGDRVRHIGISGIRGNYIRLLQRELNIEDWYQAMKHCVLFLFFGYFGGRTTVSRTILLLGAPLMILIQTRFMKLYIRQLLYAILYNPPSIVLSLLPAPQQAILSLNLSDAMKQIYGEYIIKDALTEQLLKDDPSIDDYSNKNNDLSNVLTSKRFTVKAANTEVEDDDDDEEDDEEEDNDDEEEDDDDYDEEE